MASAIGREDSAHVQDRGRTLCCQCHHAVKPKLRNIAYAKGRQHNHLETMSSRCTKKRRDGARNLRRYRQSSVSFEEVNPAALQSVERGGQTRSRAVENQTKASTLCYAGACRFASCSIPASEPGTILPCSARHKCSDSNHQCRW